MPTLQIRDMPQELYDRLVESAEINRRSLTQQAIVLLEDATVTDLKKEAKKDGSIRKNKGFKTPF